MSILPEQALKQHIAVLGKTGSGKTYTAKGIVEGLLDSQRRVCIIDPTSAWWGLRSSADGNKPGYPVVVLGGSHGDAPLPPLSGFACAELVVNNAVQVIFDTIAMTMGERTRWFTEFGGALFRLNKAPLHLVIDEAHNFAPQGKVPDPDTGKMLHAANTLASGGRSRGIRLTLITQRPAKLHKDSLTCCDSLIAMRLIAPQDREAVEEWILGMGDKAKGKQVLDSLAQLQRGEGWVWFPEGGLLERTKFPKIKTFDSSKTPDDGSEMAKPKTLAEIDLGAITSAMSEAVKQAENEDPKALRKKVGDLTEQLRRAMNTPPEQPANIDALVDAKTRTICENFRTVTEEAYQLLGEIGVAAGKITGVVQRLHWYLEVAKGEIDKPTSKPVNPILSNGTHHRPSAEVSQRPSPARADDTPRDGLTGPQIRVLNGLAELSTLGVRYPSRFQVGFFAGYTPSSGTFKNILSELRTAGLIDYPGDGQVTLTAEGNKIASASDRPRSLDDLHKRIRERLTGPQVKIFNVLIRLRGEPLGRTALGEQTGYEATSGTFKNLLSELRSLGVAKYPLKTTVAASELLFPDSLQ